MKYQIQFFSSSKLEAKKNKVKGIVFGNQKDISSTFKLIEILKYHNIKIHKLKKDIRLNEKKFSADKSFIVPLDQEKFKVIQAIFNTQKKFKDSTFYDVSSWTIPLAFDVNYENTSDLNLIGDVDR